MIKCKTYFLLLICFGFQACSNSSVAKEEPSPEAQKSVAIDNAFIKGAIVSKNSADENLEIESQLVLQKLSDLEDYINLLVEEDIPNTFAENINEQITNLIYKSDSKNVQEWIDQRIQDGIAIEFSNINVRNETIKNDEGGLIINADLDLKIANGKNEQLSFQFLFKKLEKEFGSKTIFVNEMKILEVTLTGK